MTEAERWESDIQSICDVLECSDKILSARLEHDLTPDVMPNDTQVRFRVICKCLNEDLNNFFSPLYLYTHASFQFLSSFFFLIGVVI